MAKRKTVSLSSLAEEFAGRLPNDIARCTQQLCPQRDTCLRATSMITDPLEFGSYFSATVSPDGACSSYIEDTTKRPNRVQDRVRILRDRLNKRRPA